MKWFWNIIPHKHKPDEQWEFRGNQWVSIGWNGAKKVYLEKCILCHQTYCPK